MHLVWHSEHYVCMFLLQCHFGRKAIQYTRKYKAKRIGKHRELMWTGSDGNWTRCPQMERVRHVFNSRQYPGAGLNYHQIGRTRAGVTASAAAQRRSQLSASWCRLPRKCTQRNGPHGYSTWLWNESLICKCCLHADLSSLPDKERGRNTEDEKKWQNLVSILSGFILRQ